MDSRVFVTLWEVLCHVARGTLCCSVIQYTTIYHFVNDAISDTKYLPSVNHSPSNCYLTSYEHVIEYLKTDGTCKCGLDCPFFIHRVFNFDASVKNKERNKDLQEASVKASSCKLCESNRLKGNNNFTDQILTPSPLNQTLKQAARKTAKSSSFDGSLTSKKGTHCNSVLKVLKLCSGKIPNTERGYQFCYFI
jgi:hypothetical protein